ncbi:hypothetical protein EQG49_04155 [Periweissella cryptocerci]|uniref:Uncharacterized protein n=1 Tax=Periweissella cryptocerci TaxID=2506420 RepID=A0A4P6YSS4_9LACO|nr:hypothetical protein [Periweissella cryptocerci]QBO35710.1 hypothetical protein EQG49_04155 [Periweissella cryptocerci]
MSSSKDYESVELLKQIEAGDFESAVNLVANLDVESATTILVSAANELSDFDSISVYFVVEELLRRNETAELHKVAAVLLTNIFPLRAGAYNQALHHLEKAIQLEPDNIRLQEGILFFHDIPEKLLSDMEAEKYAKRILEKSPKSKAANEMLKLLAHE